MYAKWRDSDVERQHVENDYKKQQQYFENNSSLRQALEARRSKAERNVGVAKSNFVKAAREAEPLLQQIQSGSVRPDTPVDEGHIRSIVKSETRNLIGFRDLETEIGKVERKIDKAVRDDIRKEVRNFTPKTDHDRLAQKLEKIELQQRQPSASADIRDAGLLGKEIEKVKIEIATRTAKQISELHELNQKISILQTEVMNLASKRIQPGNSSSPDDLAKVILFTTQ